MRLTQSNFLGALVAVVAAVVASVEPALAETTATGVAEYAKLGAALGIGIAAFGGALGQGKIMAAALESIARNPGAADKMFLPWLLGVIFVESLVIYALVVAFQLIG
jgi:F-type H+-transporting ATPase subunit c